jgi:antitoxin CptB
LTTVDEARLNRARFRSWRRGIREADLILGPFADARVGDMSEAELADFERLLELPDPDLYALITGMAEPAPENDNAVLAALRASALGGPAARGG